MVPKDRDIMRMQEVLLLQWLLFLVASSAPISVVATNSTAASRDAHHSFFMDEFPPMGVTYLGPAKYESSTVTCAQHCLHDYTGCISFLFNSETGLCTPSSTFNLTEPSPTPNQGLLYVIINYCNILEGFRLITTNGTTACIGNFQARVTYDEADNLCQKKGAFLVSVKTDEKLDILLHLSGLSGTRRSTWVGCDDKVEEGTYVWKEDGESFNMTNAPSTISTDLDYTDDSLEDCLCLPYFAAELHDWSCSANRFYTCEIALQSP